MFEDKPREDQRWLMELLEVKGAEHPKSENLESWNKTLLAIGIPQDILINTKDYRTKAIDQTLVNPAHVALYEHEGIRVHYRMHRKS
ncbi:hypothetical protein EEAAV_15205 [Rahnella aceris]